MRGIGNDKKRRAIFDYHRVNSDFLILLETHSSPSCERIWENEWGGKAIYSHGTTNARGVAIFMSKKLFANISNIYIDSEGRLIIIDVQENDQIITLVAVYAPNEDKPEFFKCVAKVLRDRHEKKVIVGDFNLALDVEKDRKNTYSNNNNSRDEVLNIMEEFCLKDVWEN